MFNNQSSTLLHALYSLGFGLGLSFSATATSSPVSQTQSKLQQLDAKINNLRHNLSTANDKRGVLNKELSGTEKQIAEGVRKLNTIEHDVVSKEQKVAELQRTIDHLNQELKTQQDFLANHVRARYLMGEYQPVKWLLLQEDPYKVSRILTYYQYIVSSRKQLIDKIDKTKTSIAANNAQLRTELANNKHLQHQLAQHQEELKHTKTYHTTLIESLDNEIQTKQHTLVEFQKDKDNLSRLLKSLSEQSVVQSSKPFVQMRKKLPLPIHTEHRSMQRMNQGVTFFADEGEVVTAVYPGKVVFSDWLKGYGLLLIIDHGQGFMTLYAHNQSLFKRKGQNVRQNEQVATVGHSGGIKQNGLYFEIRQRGKAVSPLGWLS